LDKQQDEYIYSREHELTLLQSDNYEVSTKSLLAITFNDEDWKWVQDLCLDLINHPNDILSRLAVTCLGHIARIHGQIDKEKVLKALKEKMRDKKIAGYVEDAISDIQMFAN